MKNFKYIFIFVFIFLFNINVFAADYNVSNKIKSSISGSSGTYQGLEIYNSGTNNNYSIGTRYNGQLSRIVFYLDSNDWDWNYNTTYTITLNMATQDWRNKFMAPQVYNSQSNGNLTGSNLFVSNSFQFISMYKIKFNFKVGSTMAPYLYFNIYSTNVSSTAFTGVSNWNLSSIVISTISNATPTPAPVPTSTPSITPTPTPINSNQDIIDNNNQNTQDIIDNNNQNTQDIIDSNVSNTSDIIENNNSNTESILESQSNINDSLNSNCKTGTQSFDSYYNYTLQKRFDSSGNIVSNSGYKISPYFAILKGTEYTININSNSTGYVCFYRATKQLLSCIALNSAISTITAPNLAYFMRVDINSNYNLQITGAICNNWQQESDNLINDSINSLDDSINNNNTQNTQDIIDNSNQNTQDIIDNSNQNTQDIIDSQTNINDSLNSNCKTGEQTFDDSYNYTTKSHFDSSGNIVSNNSYKISTWFSIKGNTEYSINTHSNSTNYACFYRSNKELLSCTALNSAISTITAPNLAYYMRVDINSNYNLQITGAICNNWEQEAQNALKDTMLSDSIDNNTSFFTDFDNNTHGLTGIITLPLSTIQTLTNNSCVSLSIPIPFTDETVSLPCMNEVYQNYIPSVYNIWQVVSFGLISYFICLDIFKMVKGFKDPNEDKVEVLDL